MKEHSRFIKFKDWLGDDWREPDCLKILGTSNIRRHGRWRNHINRTSKGTLEMVRHTLKTWPKYFQKVVNGKKKAELRLNDRKFQIESKDYTGRELLARITDMKF